MVLMGNNDAHLKNWSLSYPDGRTPQLAPAYDLVCTTFYPDLTDRLTFQLGGQTRADLIGPEQLRQVASAAGFPLDATQEIVRDTARRMRDSWEVVRSTSLLPELVEHLDGRVANHPLVVDAR